MRYLLALATLLISTNTFAKETIVKETLANNCNRWDKLTGEQQYRLQYSYTYGKQHDLQWTLAAINLAESNGGVYKVNPETGDYGLHQINITNAMNMLQIGGYWDKMSLITRLVVDDEFNAYMAVQTLEGFKRQHKGDYRKMVMSYNQGNKWQKGKKSLQLGIDYYNKVVDNVQMLKRCSGF
jgi:hypothetical protein